jgi:hypothetical protein
MTDKNKKLLMIVIPIAVVVTAAIVVGIVLLLGGNKETYRTVKIYRIEGSAEIRRGEGAPIAPYENMMLEHNDEVKTLADSYLYLKLDDDKYLLAEPETSFKLVATGDAENSKTRIELMSGAVTIHVTKPLSEDSSFEVGTANATMAIRGTSLRVSDDPGEVAEGSTVLQVFEGNVAVQLLNDGLAAGDPTSVGAGEEAIVTPTEAGVTVDKTEGGIPFIELSDATLDFLKTGIENGNDVGLSADEIDDIVENRGKTFTVSFMYNGKTFATQRVLYGETAKQPMLMPTPKGSWSFSFETMITSDLTVEWIAEK